MSLNGFLISKDGDYSFYNEKTHPDIELLTIKYFREIEWDAIDEIRNDIQKWVNKAIKKHFGEDGIVGGFAVVDCGWGTRKCIDIQVYLKIDKPLNLNKKHKRILDENSIEKLIYREIQEYLNNYFSHN